MLAPSHPNASLLPSGVAVLQDGPAGAGRDLLAAIAVGRDLVCAVSG